MNKGFIYLWRKLMEKGYYKKSSYVHLWVHLLFRANHTPNKILWSGEEITIGTGQFITGRKALSEETGIPEWTIDRILKFFESEQQIAQRKTNAFRIITIINYAALQNSAQRIAQPLHNGCTTDAQPVRTDNNDNTDNTEKNDDKEKKVGGKKEKHIPPLKEAKQKYGDYVELLPREYESLCATFGESIIKEYIVKIDDFVISKGKQKEYVDHNRMIQGWMRRDGIKKLSDDSETGIYNALP